MQVHFFAYGAFAKGQIHRSKIESFIKEEKASFVKGEMYSLRCGYPVLLGDAQGELAEGSLLTLEVTESFWPLLDALMGYNPLDPEKSFMQRREVSVLVDNYTQLNAFTYGLNPKKLTSAHKKISNNQWRQTLNQNPPLTSQLQERQKIYIKKLSQTKGRDIVPIKLDLYRELINLELVVDKGRRLALTPLGKETALFLQ